MSITVIICAVLFTHWVADFLFQTDDMALNKSKSNKWLLKHVATYSAFMLLFGPLYAVVNFVAHLCTDYVTSRITSYLWHQQRRHEFFVVIGFDQMLHAIALIVTIPLMGWWW